MARWTPALALAIGVAGVLAAPVASAVRCPPGMASIGGRFCVDAYEASVEVVDTRGRRVRTHSPWHTPSPGQRLRAQSRSGVYPQAYFSRDDAEAACREAGKRLCTDDEWLAACQGRAPTLYPYGDEREPKRCNDSGVSPLRHFHGADDVAAFGFEAMNDPRLNQVPGSLARTGEFSRCRNSYGVYDIVGNLHEWTADPTGVFRGGYYLDTTINGEGCEYRTTGHSRSYHDYSIGFRCCQGSETGTSSRSATRDSGPVSPPTASSRGTGEPGEYEVVRGDSLWSIARRNGISVAALCAANGLDRDTPIRRGQRLRIPGR